MMTNQVKATRSFKELITLFLLLATVPAFSEDLPQQGQEAEFAVTRSIGNPNQRYSDSVYIDPLNIIRKLFDDSNGKIEVKPWSKYGLQLSSASYTDPMKRVWNVVPEIVNFAYRKENPENVVFDGIELISPPLKEESDFDIYEKALQQILASEKYEPGNQSSNHMTVDVSHLVKLKSDSNGNIHLDLDSDGLPLAKTILYIEEHTPEILASVGGYRYGSLINPFCVPFSITQKKLMSQLAELVMRGHCTLGEIRNLFLEAHESEKELVQTDHRAWKYRMIQVKRLLELKIDSEKYADFVSAIEFRIPDLDPARFRPISKILRKIILQGHKLYGESHPFQDPFPRISFNSDFQEANDVILTLPRERQQKLVQALELNPSDYPPYPSIPDFEEIVKKTQAKVQIQAKGAVLLSKQSGQFEILLPERVSGLSRTQLKPWLNAYRRLLHAYYPTKNLKVELTQLKNRGLKATIQGQDFGSQRVAWAMASSLVNPLVVPQLVREIPLILPVPVTEPKRGERSSLFSGIEKFVQKYGLRPLKKNQLQSLVRFDRELHRLQLPNPIDFELSENLDALQRRKAQFAGHEFNQLVLQALDSMDSTSVTRGKIHSLLIDWMSTSGYASILESLFYKKILSHSPILTQQGD